MITEDETEVAEIVTNLSHQERTLLQKLAYEEVKVKLEKMHDPVSMALQMINQAESVELVKNIIAGLSQAEKEEVKARASDDAKVKIAAANDTVYTAYTILKEGDHELKDIVIAELSEADKENLLALLPQELKIQLLSPKARTVLEIVQATDDVALVEILTQELSQEEADLVHQLR